MAGEWLGLVEWIEHLAVNGEPEWVAEVEHYAAEARSLVPRKVAGRARTAELLTHLLKDGAEHPSKVVLRTFDLAGLTEDQLRQAISDMDVVVRDSEIFGTQLRLPDAVVALIRSTP